MSKIHLKTNSLKTILVFVMATGLVSLGIHVAMIVTSLVRANKNTPAIANPAIVQQQNIQKAYQLIHDQTIPD